MMLTKFIPIISLVVCCNMACVVVFSPNEEPKIYPGLAPSQQTLPSSPQQSLESLDAGQNSDACVGGRYLNGDLPPTIDPRCPPEIAEPQAWIPPRSPIPIEKQQ